METPSVVDGLEASKGSDVEKLSKDNFNLKLRIFYLEERLAKVRKGGETDESLQQEIMELKVLLEEKQQELDDRNLLLIKARNAIESMNTDLALYKAELDEMRSLQVNPNILADKDAEIASLRQRVREADSRDRSRMEDILRLNNQVRDVEGRGSADKAERRALEETKQRMERLLAERDQRIAELTVEVQQKAVSEASTGQACADLQGELDAMRAKLVDSAKALGEQRSREASLVTRLQEAQRIEELRSAQLQNQLLACQAERDSTLRALASAERSVEELRSQLGPAETRASSAESRINQLQAELQREREKMSAEEAKLRNSGERQLDELRIASLQSDGELRSNLAELRGKLAALEFARDEIRGRAERAEAKASALNEDLAVAKSALVETEARANARLGALERQLDEKSRELQEQSRLRHGAEEEARLQLKRSANREEDLRRRVRQWEEVLDKKLDEILPTSRVTPSPGQIVAAAQGATSFGEDDWIYGGDDEGDLALGGPEGGEENTSQNGPERPRPRQLVLEGTQKPATLGKLPGLEKRLVKMRDIKASFSQKCLEIERGWSDRVKQLLSHMERSEERLHRAEDRIGIYIKSHQALSRQSNLALRGQHAGLEQRLVEAQARAKEEASHRERLQQDKERLLETLAAVKEQGARLDGELRQSRAELESLREEKRRCDHKLEQAHAGQGVLEENNRVLSLEVEERGKQLQALGKQEQRLKNHIEQLKTSLHEHQQATAELRTKFDHVSKEARAKDKQLRDTQSKLVRSLQVSETASIAGGSGEGRQQWRDVEERSFRAPSPYLATRQQHQGSGAGYVDAVGSLLPAQLQSLERSEQVLNDLLRDAQDIVARTEAALSSVSQRQVSPRYSNSSRDASGGLQYEIHELLRANRRLALDLRGLGQDFHALHHRILVNLLSSSTASDPRPSSPLPMPLSSTFGGLDTGSRIFAGGESTPDRRLQRLDRAATAVESPTTSSNSIAKAMLTKLSKIRADLDEAALGLDSKHSTRS